MIDNTIELGAGKAYTKVGVSGQKSDWTDDNSKDGKMVISTEVTKQGMQRTVIKLSEATPTTRYASNGDSVTGRAPLSAALTLSHPLAANDETAILELMARISAAAADSVLVAKLVNGEA